MKRAAIQVWMSIYRHGMPYHRLALGTNADGHIVTACGRFVSSPATSNGILLRDDEAEQKGAGPCERCWPEGRSS